MVFACLITTVELVTSAGERKRSSSPTQKPSVEKKLKTSSTARDGLSTIGRLVSDLTSSKEKKAIGSEPVRLATLKVARTAADKIVQRKSSTMPPVPGFILKQPSISKSDMILEVHAAMKSKDGDSIAKVMPGLAPLVENEASTRMNNHEQPAKPALDEFSEIHTLLKPDLL